MKAQLCTTAVLIFLLSWGLPGFAQTGSFTIARDKLKLGMLAKEQGLPPLILERARANHEKTKSTSNCFMAMDLTSEKPQAWRVCMNPAKVEKMPAQVGSGDGAHCKRHIFKNDSCMRYFGNRKNYCLPSGGNYITQEIYSNRPNQSPFVSIKGLDEGLNDNSAGGMGLQQISKDGKVEWDKKSQSIFALPARKDGVILEDMAAQRGKSGMALYIYPSREDIKRFRDTGSAEYWSEDCAGKIGKPGWLGDKNASDTPSPSEVKGVAVTAPAAKATAKSSASGK